MKTRELNASEFPAPAVTICSNLFSRNNSANFYETNKKFFSRIPMNYSKQECERFAANLAWCQPSYGVMAEKVCKQHDILNIDMLEVIKESALQVS